MSLLETFLPTPQTVLYLGNVALAVAWLCAAALLAAFVCRRRPAPIRHGLLLLGLVLVLASPTLAWVAGRAGIGRFQVALSERREPIDEPEVVPDAPRPIVDARQEPPAMETDAAWERTVFAEEQPAFVAGRHAIVPDTPVELAHSPRFEPDPHVDQVENPEEAAPAPTASWWRPIAQGLALVWAFGTVTSLLWLARGLVRLAAFCRGLRKHPVDGVRQAVERAAAQAGLARAPRLFVSARAAMPITFGLFRPAIVLPEKFADDLPPAQLHAVLLHEIAHVARRDPWVGLAQRLAAAFYWWCPLVHWLNQRLADLREEVCDNYVLHRQGDGAGFAEVLVALAERVAKPSSLPATVSVIERRGARERSRALEHRIRRLLSTETNPMIRMNRAGSVSMLLAGLGIAVLVSMSQVRVAGQDSAATQNEATNGSTPPGPASDASGSTQPATAAAQTSDASESALEKARVISEIESLDGWLTRDESLPGRPVYEIVLRKNEFTDQDLERLRVFDNLRVLFLGHMQVTECKLTRMPDLSQLQELGLMRMTVSTPFLESLQQLPKLEALRLCRANVSDFHLEPIGKLHRLRTLWLEDTLVTNAGLAHLANLPRLENLYLDDTLITDAGLKHLAKLPQLKKLGHDGTRITKEGLEAALPQFRSHSVDWKQVSDADLAHLNQLTELTALDLVGSRITDAGLKHLQRATRLEELKLGHTVTDAGMENLSGLTTLRKLNLYHTKITEDGLEHLCGLTQLERLHLPRKMTLGDAGLAHLGRLSQLRELDLHGSGVTDQGLRHLRGMSQLQSLNLAKTRITDTGLEHVRGLTKLRILKLADTEVAGPGLVHLRQHASVKELDLNGTPLTDEGLAELRDIELGDLFVANTKVTNVGMEHVGHIESLRDLDLSGTRVADNGLAHLPTGLRGLRLGGTQITDAGLVHLRGLTKLTYLQLWGTQVSDEGLEYLAGLKALQYLYLSRTRVTGKGLVHLRELPRLYSLYLGGMEADAAAIRRFKKDQPNVRIVGWDEPSKAVQFTTATEKPLAMLEEDTRVHPLTLAQLVVFLQDQHQIPIRFDQPRLDAASISTDVPIAYGIRDLELHYALRLILTPLRLTHVIRNDALEITTVEKVGDVATPGVISAEQVEREFAKHPTNLRRQRRVKVINALLKETRLQLSDSRLEDAVAAVQKRYEVVSLGIDRPSLAAAGIPLDVPCSVNTEDVPLILALQELAASAGLALAVNGERIVITTRR